MLSQEIFQRFEVKYLLPFSKYQEIAGLLSSNQKMRYDQYGDETGRYNIVSLYFDSDDNKIYYETRNKLDFRQKLRLRVYDKTSTESTAFFEIKQKFNNVVNKRRTALQLADAYDYLKHSPLDQGAGTYESSNPQIMREVETFRSLYGLKPRVVVSYDRQAFHGIEDSDLRVTFDYNLTARDHNLRIEDGPQGTNFVDPDLVVMEVKVSKSVPFWLARLLSDLECSKESVSKFCTSIDLMEEMRQQPVSSKEMQTSSMIG